MDLHVIGTLGEYAFRRVVTGWFLRLLLGAAGLALLILFFHTGPDPRATLLANRAFVFQLTGLTAAVLVIAMGATELPREIETRSILLLLARPIRRSEVVLGKYLGLLLVALFTLLVLVSANLVGCALQGLSPDLHAAQQALLLALILAVLAGVVTLLSTCLGEIALISCTCAYAAFGYFGFYLKQLARLPELPETAAIPMYLFYYPVCNFRFLEIPAQAGPSGTLSASHIGLGIGYAAAHIAFLLLLAIFSFGRRDLSG